MEESEKKCRLCGEIKPIENFSIRSDSGKRRSECRDCKLQYLKEYRNRPENKLRAKELNRRYHEGHRAELNIYSREYQREHLDKFRLYNKKYRDNMTQEQKESANERGRKYREKRKNDEEYIMKRREWGRASAKRRRKEITAHEEARKKIDPVFKLKKQVRNGIRASFNRYGLDKVGSTKSITGLDANELYNYLQQTYFDRYGEPWDGKELVHIDHIVPLATAHTREDVIKLNFFMNLQLLKAADNLEKGSRVPSSHDGM